LAKIDEMCFSTALGVTTSSRAIAATVTLVGRFS